MKRTLLLLVFILTINSTYCQTTLTKGKVVDDKLTELLAVNVKNTNSGQHVLTGKNGNFEIETNIGDTLIFSYIGLTDELIVVAEITRIKLIMTDKSVNCLGAEWSKRDYKKADKRIKKRLKTLYKEAEKKSIW
jgi:hypothetical protein